MGTDLPLRVIFVVPYAPTRIRTRAYHLIRALAAAGVGVTVATSWANEEERWAIDALGSIDGVREVIAEPVPRRASVWNCVRAVSGGEPLQAHFSWSRRLAERIAAVVESGAIDVVHVEHLRGVRYGLALGDRRARRRTRAPALVWDAVDCITALFRRTVRESQTWRARQGARLELARTERFEAAAAGHFDRVVVVSDGDRRALLDLPAGDRLASRIDVVSNGVDLAPLAATVGRDQRTIIVTGKMSYHANATAVLWLARRVMPEVWAALPDARLRIVGSRPTRQILALAGPRIEVTGEVPSIADQLARATVAVAPIQYGVGVQNKVLEALASATALVATEQAVGDLAVRAGRELLVAGSPSAFARAIVELVEDHSKRNAIGSAGRAFVERHHGWPVMAARLIGVYKEAFACC